MPSKKQSKQPKPVPANQALIGSFFQTTKEAPRATITFRENQDSIVSKKRDPVRRKPLGNISVNVLANVHKKTSEPGMSKAPLPMSLLAPTGKSYLDEISVLTLMQKAAFDAVVTDGVNVFISGPGGTGKSHLLKKLVYALKQKYKHKTQVGISASTNLAACNIGGVTLHRLLGIGLGNSDVSLLFEQIKTRKVMYRRWKSLKVLLIDEILMLDASIFTKLDQLGQMTRSNDRPFGGIQIVCSGDFFQLPPVEIHKGFCFTSPSWASTFNQSFVLRVNFRQKSSQLINLLNMIRTGSQTLADEQFFQLLQRPLVYPPGEVQATELFPIKAQVKDANREKLRVLPGRMYRFESKDTLLSPHESSYFDGLMCENILDLKVGAQVMYLKTDPEQLVFNGSMGKVIAFASEGSFRKMKSEMQLSSKSGFLDLCVEAIQTQCGPGIECENDTDTLKVNLSDHSKELGPVLYPLVWFKTRKGESILHVKPVQFDIEVTGFEHRVSRRQLPLLLSWAMSIHKAQGQSIERLKVDLGKSFANGQVYVGLSRATNSETLQICNFKSHKITVSRLVRDFYDTLASQEGSEGDKQAGGV